MYLQQLVKEDLGGVGYLVGNTGAAVCAVVDPRLDMVEDILELVAAKGMRITAVIESHLHADSVSGCRELARRTGATIYVHERAAVDYPHQQLTDGVFRLFSATGGSTTRLTHQGEPILSSESNAVLVHRYLEEVIHQGNSACSNNQCIAARRFSCSIFKRSNHMACRGPANSGSASSASSR